MIYSIRDANDLLEYTENRLKALKTKKYANYDEEQEIRTLSRLVNKTKGNEYGILYVKTDDSLDELIESQNSGENDDINDVLDNGYDCHKGYAFQGPLNKLQAIQKLMPQSTIEQ